MKTKKQHVLLLSGAFLCLVAVSCTKNQGASDQAKILKLSSKNLNLTSSFSGPPSSSYDPSPLFSDEFTGRSYDSIKWFPRTDVAHFDTVTVTDQAQNIRIVSGELFIDIKKVAGTHNYTCGGLISKVPMGYGYYEARVAVFKTSAGVHQSFWNYGAGGFSTTANLVNQDLLPNKNTVLEIDGFEANSLDQVFQYNNHTYIPTHTASGGQTLGTRSSWCIVGFEWLPDKVNFYLDGTLIGHKDLTGIYSVYAPQQIWLTAKFIPTCHLSSGCWYDFGGNTPLTDPLASMKISYFKYYPNNNLTGINLLANPSFEYLQNGVSLQDPIGWIETRSIAGYDPTASTVMQSTSAEDGGYLLTHTSTADYTTTTKQILSYISNGTYKLTAWVKSSSHVTPSRMRILNYGGTELYTNINTASTWQQITISGINVTNNQAVIAFTSTAKANEWIDVDNVSFEKM